MFFVNSARSFFGHSMSVYSTRLSTMRYITLIDFLVKEWSNVKIFIKMSKNLSIIVSSKLVQLNISIKIKICSTTT